MWLTQWPPDWRDESFEVCSPLPIGEVRRRLAAELVSPRGSTIRSWSAGGQLVVVGRLDEDFDEVDLRAVRTGTHSSWSAILRGRLVSTTRGCVLTGRLGMSPAVRVFTAVWLGLVGLSLLVVLGVAVHSALSGDLGAAGNMAKLSLVPLGMVAFMVALVTAGARTARDETKYLLEWLADRLELDEPFPLAVDID